MYSSLQSLPMGIVVKQASYIIIFMEHIIYKIKQEISNVKQILGVEFSSKIVQVNQKKIRMQMWDTAGQERYKALTKGYYRGALGARIVFDITDSVKPCQNGLNMLEITQNHRFRLLLLEIKLIWIWKAKCNDQIENHFSINCQMVLPRNEVQYFETSETTGYQINETFIQITTRILDLFLYIDANLIKPKFLTSIKSNQQQNAQCNC